MMRDVPSQNMEEAERECLDAIVFALEGAPDDYDADAEAVTFKVNVATAA